MTRKLQRQGLSEEGVNYHYRLLSLSGPIECHSYEKVLNFALTFHDAKPVTIFLSTPGGSLVDGFAIFDLISSMNNHVTIKVFGEASSMGAIILQAADHRVIGLHSSLMLHDGYANPGPTNGRDMDAFATYYRRERARFYQILSKKAGGEIAYYKKRLANDWYLSAQEALKENLVDEIL